MTAYLLAGEQGMDATGTVQPQNDWVETPEGKRVKSEYQARNAKGELLWLVETTRPVKQWDRVVEKVAQVVVPSPTKPQVERHQPIRFSDLVVEVHVSRGGALVENFSAGGIEDD